MTARKKKYDYTAEMVAVITSKPWPIEPRFRRILRKLVRQALGESWRINQEVANPGDKKMHTDRIAKELVP